MNVIPLSVKKKCIEMTMQGMTSKEVYIKYYSKYYNTSYEGFRSMLKRWKKKVYADNEILENGNLGYKFTPHATTMQVNGDDDIVQSWIKGKSEDNIYLELIEEVKK